MARPYYGLAWSVLGLSAGGLSLLIWLVRTQGPTRMSMLLLLVPPLAAVEAWLLFGEKLVPVQLAGFALALTGVLLGGRRASGKRLANRLRTRRLWAWDQQWGSNGAPCLRYEGLACFEEK